MEILAHRSYEALHYDVNFWRTKTGLEFSPRVHEGIEILPWRVFLNRLWAGELIK